MPRSWHSTAKKFQFVDQGGNFKHVLCPHCGAEIATADWQAAMDQAWLGSFAD